MTDGRYPERWLNDRRIVRLSPLAHRTFVTTLVWSVANRTDGVIELDDLVLIPGADPRTVPELLRSGLWAEAGPRTVSITVYEETQTSRDDLAILENARRRQREKKRRQRSVSPGMSPGTNRGTALGQARTGQDTPGQDEHRVVHPPTDSVSQPADGWPGR